MKNLIIISTFLVIVAAVPTPQILAPATLVLGTPIQQQYHAQDALGQYAYGYTDGLSAKQETKSFDGVTRGGYSYVDAAGKLQTVSYSADAINGFRVAATNLPKALPVPEPLPQIAPLPVVETPEVIAARDEHLRAIDEAKLRVAAAPIINVRDESVIAELPKPVEDTPEVARAKTEHFAAVKEAELRNAAIETRVAAPIAETTITAPLPLPVPVARIAPILTPTAYFQPTAFRTIPLPSGFAYSYGYANTPFAWDSRFLVSATPISAN